MRKKEVQTDLLSPMILTFLTVTSVDCNTVVVQSGLFASVTESKWTLVQFLKVTSLTLHEKLPMWHSGSGISLGTKKIGVSVVRCNQISGWIVRSSVNHSASDNSSVFGKVGVDERVITCSCVPGDGEDAIKFRHIVAGSQRRTGFNFEKDISRQIESACVMFD